MGKGNPNKRRKVYLKVILKWYMFWPDLLKRGCKVVRVILLLIVVWQGVGLAGPVSRWDPSPLLFCQITPLTMRVEEMKWNEIRKWCDVNNEILLVISSPLWCSLSISMWREVMSRIYTCLTHRFRFGASDRLENIVASLLVLVAWLACFSLGLRNHSTCLAVSL